LSISVLIVDDEAMARKRIRRLLSEEPAVTLDGECRNGREALEAIAEYRPDLVFLDVQMPELDGFGVLRALEPELIPTVIFVTAYDAYAVHAFEVHALDYLLKPFDAQRFRDAFQRARAYIERQRATPGDHRVLALLEQLVADRGAGPARSPGHYLERFVAKVDGRMFPVRTDTVDWIESAGNYVRLHVGQGVHTVRDTMSALETKLDPQRFARIHRSTIVNLDRIGEIQPWFGGDYMIILRNGTRLKLSRWYRDSVGEALAGGFPET
jgi:two-component system LytT family response regulator